MITYYELGATKKLHEIVVAGSHDAGITGGGANVQTQDLPIFQQAQAGVRVFDLRIAAQTSGSYGGHKGVTLKAFHADKKLMVNETKSRHSWDANRRVQVTRTKFRGGMGAFGESLHRMLTDARNFVSSREGGSEFLILKFDKCKNWRLIADTCIDVLGNSIYRGGGNVNAATLQQLAGRVIVVFSEAGLMELRTRNPNPGQPLPNWAHLGILGFSNLKEGGGYLRDYHGVQYYGKGGTNPFNFLTNKLKQNLKKQRKLIRGAGEVHSDVLGMMYWTTTGLKESIEQRNARMWDPPNIQRLKKMWAEGLQDYVEYQVVDNGGGPALGMQRRRSMPNIVMIDFADEEKCRHIRELNDLTDYQLASLQA